MKAAAIICSLLLFSCAATQVKSPPPQEVRITIDSNQPIDHINVKQSDDVKVSRAMEVTNPDMELSRMTRICDGKAYITIWGGIVTMDQLHIWNDFIVLKNTTDIRDIDIFISSPGGNAFDGLGMAEQIERAVDMGFNITAYASGIVASAAVPVFAVCPRRIASPGTIFMVHEAAMFKWGYETASDIRSQKIMMDMLSKRYVDMLVKNTKITESEWHNMERETTWFTAQEAMEYGLVDEIR